MRLSPLALGFRQFNIFLCLLSLCIVLLAVRKLSESVQVPVILILVSAVVGVIMTSQHLRTRRGAVLLGCTRRYFEQVQNAMLRDKALGTVYKPGRGIGFIRELYAHHRNTDANDKLLLADLRNYISAQGQFINPRESLLLLSWLLVTLVVTGIVAWLLLV